MIRIWVNHNPIFFKSILIDAALVNFFPFQNYNKSRIHSYRGAKDVILQLDGITIFDGEIARASGDISGSVDSFGDVSD